MAGRWSEALLPGGLRQSAESTRSALDNGVDAVLVLLAGGIGFLVLSGTWSSHGPALVALDVSLGVGSLGLLGWRRHRPDLIGVVVVAASTVSALAAGAMLVALFTVAQRGSARALAAVVALSAVNVVVFPLLYPQYDSYVANLVLGALLMTVMLGWGLFSRARRAQVVSLRAHATQLETEQQLREDRARQVERRAIAHEMHDVLAHRISLLSVHAGALEYNPGAPPQQVAESAAVIRASACAALAELREVLGVLREAPGPDGARSNPAPPPTVTELVPLVEESRAAGMAVSCSVELPDGVALPPVSGRTAYRLVQEGLTNARKHAPGEPVAVSVRAVPAGEHRRLAVQVLNPVPAGNTPPAVPGTGTGLTGLGERVALAGGELEHFRSPQGEFVLRAHLPWSP